MITFILTSTAIYILSIFGCRYYFRLYVKKNVWCKESGQIELSWFIPIVNTFLCLGMMTDKDLYSFKPKSKFLKWFTNTDL